MLAKKLFFLYFLFLPSLVFSENGEDISLFPEKFTTDTGIEMILVKGADFSNIKDDYLVEKKLALNINQEIKNTYVSRFEITKNIYKKYTKEKNIYMPQLDSEFHKKTSNKKEKLLFLSSPGDLFPINNLSYNEVEGFIEWASEKDKITYRLPSEEEWEYFAGAGMNTNFWWGNNWSYGIINCQNSTYRKISPFNFYSKVGFYPCNTFGLYDILGNVPEWTQSDFESGNFKIIKGGAYDWNPMACSIWYRSKGHIEEKKAGFRLVCDLNKSNIDSIKKIKENNAVTSKSETINTKENKEDLIINLNNVKIKLKKIDPGFLTMGTDPENPIATKLNDNKISIEITKPFWISETEITQEQFEAVMGFNPSFYKSINNPVESVTHIEATKFCEEISISLLDKNDIYEYRLPTEAEWELSCGEYDLFNNEENRSNEVNFDSTTGPTSVASKNANKNGVFDMIGNVNEWCHGKYWNYSGFNNIKDPIGHSSGSPYYVVKGGGWNSSFYRCNDFARPSLKSDQKFNFVGFRIVLGEKIVTHKGFWKKWNHGNIDPVVLKNEFEISDPTRGS